MPSKPLKEVGKTLHDDVAPLLVFLSSDEAAGVTGQCIGLGGDKLSLWSHPKEISVAFRDGGWTADAIAEVWSTSVGAELETYGIQFLGGTT